MYYLLLPVQELSVTFEGVIILIPLPFLLFIKVENFFSKIYYFLWIFIFRNFFLIVAFLKSINPSLILFTNCSFLVCLALIKSFAKNDGF